MVPAFKGIVAAHGSVDWAHSGNVLAAGLSHNALLWPGMLCARMLLGREDKLGAAATVSHLFIFPLPDSLL